ncbi:hypothetical protein H4J58_01800 [Colwellia sp. MB3u-70]|uniref:hypothetical protein n=1 Tax=unclassified Colwellia TaxID=196834 RepID=UPI0015F654C3|nr:MULTISPECIES: hypothetical protein [unclassified Colwellia]MBA6291433.1 hypothetical protein [Colwellia sp. MB3u-8]MBA6305870.1 hypothetical protein [Colwellia sp. MB3u-70]
MEIKEKKAKAAIANSNSPYIGLMDQTLNDAEYKFLTNALFKAGGKFSNLERGLKQYPALFVSHIVRAVQSNFGGSGSSAVYGCLNLAIGKPTDTVSKGPDREKLWKAFRRACSRLDLPVSNRLFGSNYMVDAYLEQVGVADAFKDQVRARMERFATQNGLPDEYDIDSQKAWYSQFCASINTSLSTRVKRALENDIVGFYLNEFLNEVAQENNLTLNSIYKQSIMPLLKFDGECLLLSVFPENSKDQRWSINLDNENQQIDVYTEQCDIFIDSFSIKNISAELVEQSESKINFSLWKDDKNNQLAIFDAESNRFLSSHSLVEDGVVLSPGRYFVLSRFEINEEWLTTMETLQDGFYCGELVLTAGASYVLKRGPISFKINVHSQALIEFIGKVNIPYSGPSFYSPMDLSISADLPKEWDAGDYEVEISSAGKEYSHTIEVSSSSDVRIELNIFEIIKDWASGLYRISVVLKRKGQNRILAKNTTLVWCGLHNIKNNYQPILQSLPSNFIKDRSENVRFDENENRVVIKDHGIPFVTLAFKLYGNRDVLIKFALPGTYIYIDDLSAEIRKETLLKSGSTISASFSDKKIIRIYSTESGTLQIGNRMLHDDFKKKPWVKYSTAALFDHIDSVSNTLSFHTENYTEVLLNLVSPHFIKDWQASSKQDSIEVDFTSFTPLSSLAISAVELVSDTQQKKVFDVNAGLLTPVLGELGGMLIVEDGLIKNKHKLQLHTENLTDGAWVLTLDCKMTGRWGRLTNERGDQFVIGVIVVNGRIEEYGFNIERRLKYLNQLEKTKILNRVNNQLSTCFELSCWQSVSWLKTLWLSLINDGELMSSDNLSNILPLIERKLDENSALSWVPQLHIGGYKPDIYARHTSAYRRTDASRSVNLRCFKGMYESHKSLVEAVQNELLADALVVGFSNTKAIINSDERPKNLNTIQVAAMFPYTFTTANWEKMQREDKEPALGDLLGSFHLAYVQRECLYNCRRTEVGNDFLRPAMNRLAFKYQDSTLHKMPNLIPVDFFVSEQEQELLISLETLASGIAKACRAESRNEYKLAPLMATLETELLQGSTNLAPVLSFFFSIAGGLFHYYLLLWELYFESRES